MLRLQSVTSRRWYSSKFSLKRKQSINLTKTHVHPVKPARTRFAPSPTGFLHLGSLRTALYNYLLAKNTKGTFVLRLEDTDQKRLVKGAEANIYETLAWCGIDIDEGPNKGGPYGPYRQSERMDIYKKYAEILISNGYAYYCSCSKERLNHLRETASQLKPPTTVTYDRTCFNSTTPTPGSVVRFKSPDVYERMTDLLHGELNLQPQFNYEDRRYDDFVIMKSDGLPTYHFANVVDDHLMKITHVIRGEEWLPSTPKHVALYRAFGWEPPIYVHIPLLTSVEDKKLSKRSGDMDILSLKDRGLLPEAIVNFVALFGWSPSRSVSNVSIQESMTMEELIEAFSLDNLTKGNAKVNDSKLHYFNKFHLNERIKDPNKLTRLVEDFYPEFKSFTHGAFDKDYLKEIVKILGPSLNNLEQIKLDHSYIFGTDYPDSQSFLLPQSKEILSKMLELPSDTFDENVSKILQDMPSIKKKDIFRSVRFALTGGASGLTIPLLINILGETEYKERLRKCIKLCTN